MTEYRALHVVKVGSSGIGQPALSDELAALARTGARVLVVAGGALGVTRYFRSINRPVRMLDRPDGSQVRYCPPEEMPHIRDAYRLITLPALEEELRRRGLAVLAQTADAGGLVRGEPGGPIRAVFGDRQRLVRDHRCGTVRHVDEERLHAVLRAFDVVCLSPPITDESVGLLNIDADVLAAELAVALGADHLRFVTGTAGLLADPAAPHSTVDDLTEGRGLSLAVGRMRQKVRAAEQALDGVGDVAISGPHRLRPRTWFWRSPSPPPDLQLLWRAVQIPSVSGDEATLAHYLAAWCERHGLAARVDEVGNLVATKGTGRRRLLLLGHLDTVPYQWCPQWDGTHLSGRGCVDAKASLCAFLEVAARIPVPDDTELRVVGAVEEEISSAGGFHVRDHYPADAVIVGEPSGARRLTLGYHGLCKLAVSVREPAAHTAVPDRRTAADRLTNLLELIRAEVLATSTAAIVAIPSLRAGNHGVAHQGSAVIEMRVPQGVDVQDIASVVLRVIPADVRVELLRATPSVVTPRSDPLASAFSRALRARGLPPRFVTKTGTSDMNTLATTWRGVPMVAYGPGDSRLDHTPHEQLSAEEYRLAIQVLGDAIGHWMSTAAETRRATVLEAR
jgi:acetylornithine deacetylase